MSRRYSCVQFTHPGLEHGPDKDSNCKSWNKAGHRRKFLETTGDAIQADGKFISNVALRYWGEWEPESKVQALLKSKALYPKWLHSLIAPTPKEIKNILKKCKSGGCHTTSCNTDVEIYQNTDPFIFNGPFCYGICKQTTNKGKTLTKMSKLAEGDVILFGSTKGTESKNAFFQLDTVFVIGTVIEYDPSDLQSLVKNKKVSQHYLDWSLRIAHAAAKPGGPKLKLYLGATHEQPYNDMYSYVPAKRSEDSPNGFARVQLKDIFPLRNNLNAAPKYTSMSENDIVNLWMKIRDIVIKQNCIQAVYLKI